MTDERQQGGLCDGILWVSFKQSEIVFFCQADIVLSYGD